MNNIIEIKGRIDTEAEESFNRNLRLIKPESQYGVEISGPGGDITPTRSIINLMQTIKMPSLAKAGSVVGSASLYIYMQGFYRVCGAESEFLLHRHRDKNDLIPTEVTEEELKFLGMVSFCTGLEIDRIVCMAKANNGDGTKFYAKDAIDWGFAHNVVKY